VIVVDASALTDFLLGRPQTITALDLELAGHEHEPMHAPDLVESETLNALRRLARSGAVADQRATEAVSDLARVRLVRYPHAPLRERVWALRNEMTAYDAAYLALADALGDSVLVTSDGALAERARNALGRERVRLVD
jgi:predicted nucleic acid-binding protein